VAYLEEIMKLFETRSEISSSEVCQRLEVSKATAV
jgi:Mn-dependent DtxR family transcriptional regulator